MRLLRRHVLGLAAAFAALSSVAPVHAAGTVNAAVAANFTQVATDLAAKFKDKTGDDVKLSFGATGALYTQITQAAPFDVFLSADDKRTATAIKDGFGIAGTDFTYAVGKVVLYSPTLDLTNGDAVLIGNAFAHIAIADPKAAPYGAAAMATLDKLGLTAAVTPKIVTGESITQTQQFGDQAERRTAEAGRRQSGGEGFPRLSQVGRGGGGDQGGGLHAGVSRRAALE